MLTDGAWGTALQSLGLLPGENADAWNLTHPERVFQVARSYVEAGSQIILTNTFRSLSTATTQAGAAISLRAAAGRAQVFGAVGPEWRGSCFAELADEGVQGLLIETITNLQSASKALRTARATGLPIAVSFAFGYGEIQLPEAVRQMESEGAFAVGVNCTDMVTSIHMCRQISSLTHLPVWIKPNAGQPQWIDGSFVYRMTAAQFATGAVALAEAGATYIGGCCGTTAAFLRAAAAALQSQ